MKALLLQLNLLFAFFVVSSMAHAGSATWNLNPTSNNWHNAANWTPETVPNADSDTAIFGVSNTTTIRLSRWAQGVEGVTTTLDKLVFEEGASSYSIRVIPAGIYGVYFAFDGEGVINDSTLVQNFVVGASADYI